MPPDIALIIAGSLLGGLVNGLTGFGTALVAMPLFLLAAPPATAAMLAAALAVAGHMQSLPVIWRSINWRRASPLIIGGLLGIPCGTALLPHVSLPWFKLIVGIVLVGYCSFMLAGGARVKIAGAGAIADAIVGVGGGILAGLAALSGPLPVIWATLQGWGKDERRGVFQAYNAAILAAMLASSAAAGFMTSSFFGLLLWALPGGLIGTFVGLRIYRRLDDRRFDRLVLMLVFAAGVALVVSSQAG